MKITIVCITPTVNHYRRRSINIDIMAFVEREEPKIVVATLRSNSDGLRVAKRIVASQEGVSHHTIDVVLLLIVYDGKLLHRVVTVK